jgi:hypothetical protein
MATAEQAAYQNQRTTNLPYGQPNKKNLTDPTGRGRGAVLRAAPVALRARRVTLG